MVQITPQMKVKMHKMITLHEYCKVYNLHKVFFVKNIDDDREFGAVEVFLAAAGLTDYIPVFAREKIDLEVSLQNKQKMHNEKRMPKNRKIPI